MIKTTITEITRSPQNLKVDREAGVIFGVKILGRRSENKRDYTEQALRGGITLYEGTCVYIDHAKGRKEVASRSYRDRFGRLQNVRFRDDGLFADFHFNPKHDIAEQFGWDAEHDSTAIGFSHVADVKMRRGRGRATVEQIDKVYSVDLVAEPATTASLFESKEREGAMPTIREIALQTPARVWGVHFLREITEQDAMMAAAADAPVDVPAESTNEDRVKAAFREMVIAAFDDESLDAQATIAKIKEIMKAQEKLLEGGEKPEEPASGEEEVTAEQAIPALHKSLEEAFGRFGVKLDALTETLTREQTKPRSTPRRGSIGDDVKPITTEEFVSAIRT